MDGGLVGDGGPTGPDGGNPGHDGGLPRGDGGVIPPDGTLTVLATDPSSADQNAIFGAHVTFNEAVNPLSAVDPNNVRVLDSSGASVPGSLVYDGSTRTVILTYDAPLTLGDAYTLQVANVTNTDAANLTSVVPVTLDFTPLEVRWQLFREAQPTESLSTGQDTDPRIVWTPGGVHVIGRYQQLPDCMINTVAADTGGLVGLDVVDGGLVAVPVVASDGSSCATDTLTAGATGPIGHFIARSGGTAFALLTSLNGNTTPAAELLEYAGHAWVSRATASPTSPIRGLFSDGSSVALAMNETRSSIAQFTYDSATATLGPSQAIGVSDSYFLGAPFLPYVSAGQGDDYFLAGVTQPSDGGLTATVVQRSHGAYVPIGVVDDPGVGTIDAIQMLEVDGYPWIFRSEGGGTVRAWTTSIPPGGLDSLNWSSTQALAADKRFQAALLGRTGYVVSNQGGLTLSHIPFDIDVAWVPVPGPGGSPTIEADPSCTNSAPAIAAGSAELWIAYSESCAISGTSQLFTTVVLRAY